TAGALQRRARPASGPSVPEVDEGSYQPPPNGSRLSCGRPARRRKGVGRTARAPPGAQHSDSLEASTARQLQALVRRRLHRVSRKRDVMTATERIEFVSR